MSGLISEREKYIQENLTLNSRCHICGHKIAGCQVAASFIEAEVIDWVAKGQTEISLNICEECWQKILSNKKDDLNGCTRGEA